MHKALDLLIHETPCLFLSNETVPLQKMMENIAYVKHKMKVLTYGIPAVAVSLVAAATAAVVLAKRARR